jgi:hypothetical protein
MVASVAFPLSLPLFGRRRPEEPGVPIEVTSGAGPSIGFVAPRVDDLNPSRARSFIVRIDIRAHAALTA